MSKINFLLGVVLALLLCQLFDVEGQMFPEDPKKVLDVDGPASVRGYLEILKNLEVSGPGSEFEAGLTVIGNTNLDVLTVVGDAQLLGDLTDAGTLTVTGITRFNSAPVTVGSETSDFVLGRPDGDINGTSTNFFGQSSLEGRGGDLLFIAGFGNDSENGGNLIISGGSGLTVGDITIGSTASELWYAEENAATTIDASAVYFNAHVSGAVLDATAELNARVETNEFNAVEVEAGSLVASETFRSYYFNANQLSAQNFNVGNYYADPGVINVVDGTVTFHGPASIDNTTVNTRLSVSGDAMLGDTNTNDLTVAGDLLTGFSEDNRIYGSTITIGPSDGPVVVGPPVGSLLGTGNSFSILGQNGNCTAGSLNFFAGNNLQGDNKGGDIYIDGGLPNGEVILGGADDTVVINHAAGTTTVNGNAAGGYMSVTSGVVLGQPGVPFEIVGHVSDSLTFVGQNSQVGRGGDFVINPGKGERSGYNGEVYLAALRNNDINIGDNETVVLVNGQFSAQNTDISSSSVAQTNFRTGRLTVGEGLTVSGDLNFGGNVLQVGTENSAWGLYLDATDAVFTGQHATIGDGGDLKIRAGDGHGVSSVGGDVNLSAGTINAGLNGGVVVGRTDSGETSFAYLEVAGELYAQGSLGLDSAEFPSFPVVHSGDLVIQGQNVHPGYHGGNVVIDSPDGTVQIQSPIVKISNTNSLTTVNGEVEAGKNAFVEGKLTVGDNTELNTPVVVLGSESETFVQKRPTSAGAATSTTFQFNDNTAGNGSTVVLAAGNSGGGKAGDVNIMGGDGASGDGGDVLLKAGVNGGTVFLQPNAGDINIGTHSNNKIGNDDATVHFSGTVTIDGETYTDEITANDTAATKVRVTGDASVRDLHSTGSLNVDGSLFAGITNVEGNVIAEGHSAVGGTFWSSPSGVAELAGSLDVIGDFEVAGEANVVGNSNINTLSVTGIYSTEGSVAVHEGANFGAITVGESVKVDKQFFVEGQIESSEVQAKESITLANAEVFSAVLGEVNINGNLTSVAATFGGSVRAGDITGGDSIFKEAEVETTETGDVIANEAANFHTAAVSDVTIVQGAAAIEGDAHAVNVNLTDLSAGNVNSAVADLQGLTAGGDASFGDVTVAGTVTIGGDLIADSGLLGSNLAASCEFRAENNAQLNDLEIYGEAWIGGSVNVELSATVVSAQIVGGATTDNLTVSDTFAVDGSFAAATLVTSTLTVEGQGNLHDINVTGPATFGSLEAASLQAALPSTVGDFEAGAGFIGGNVDTNDLAVGNDLYVNGDVSILGNKLVLGTGEGDFTLGRTDVAQGDGEGLYFDGNGLLVLSGGTSTSESGGQVEIRGGESNAGVGGGVSINGGNVEIKGSGVSIDATGEVNIGSDIAGAVYFGKSDTSVEVRGSLNVSSDASFSSSISVSGDTTIEGSVNANSYISSEFASFGPVTSSFELSALDINVGGSATVSIFATVEEHSELSFLNVGGDIALSGNLGSSGEVIVEADLAVGGDVAASAPVSSEGLWVGRDVYVEFDVNVENSTTFNDLLVETRFEVTGDATFDRNIVVHDSAYVEQGITAGGDVYVGESLTVATVLNVTGISVASGDVSADGDVATAGVAQILQDASIERDLTVAGNATIGQSLLLGESASVEGGLTVDGQATFGTLSAGTVVSMQDVNLEGSLFVNGSSIVGAGVSIAGTLRADSADFGEHVSAQSLSIVGDANVTADASFGGALNVAGNFDGIQITGNSLLVEDSVTSNGDVAVGGHAELNKLSVAGTFSAPNLHVSENLRGATSASFSNSATVTGDASSSSVQSGSAFVGSLYITGNATVAEHGTFHKDATLNDDLGIGGTLHVVKNLDIGNDASTGSLNVYGNLVVVDSATIGEDLTVDGSLSSSGTNNEGNTYIGGNAEIDGNANVEGEVSLTGLTVNDVLSTDSIEVAADGSIGGTLSVAGDVAIGCDGVSVEGNLEVGGNLGVSGDFDIIAGDANVQGGVSTTGSVHVSNNLFVSGVTTLEDVEVTEIAISGSVTFGDDLSVSNIEGNALYVDESLSSTSIQVDGDSSVGGVFSGAQTIIDGSLNVEDNLFVLGGATFGDDLHIGRELGVNGTLNATGNAQVSTNANFGGDLTVNGYAVFASDVYAGASFTSTSLNAGSINTGILYVNNADLASDLRVAQGATFGGDFNAGDALLVRSDGVAANISVRGDSFHTGDLSVTGSFYAQSVSAGSTVVGGANVGGSLYTKESVSIEGDLGVGGTVGGKDLHVGQTFTTGSNSIAGDLYVCNDLTAGAGVFDDVAVDGAFAVTLESFISGELNIHGDIAVAGDVVVASGINVHGNAGFTGNVNVGDYSIGGNQQIFGNLSSLTVSTSGLFGSSDVVIGSSLIIGGDLDVLGTSEFSSEVVVAGGLSVLLDAYLQNVSVYNDVVIGNAANIGGGAQFFGGLTIVGDAQIDGNLNLVGATQIDGDFTANYVGTSEVDVGGDIYAQVAEVFSSTVIEGDLNEASFIQTDSLTVAGNIYAERSIAVVDLFGSDVGSVIFGDDVIAETANFVDLFAKSVSVYDFTFSTDAVITVSGKTSAAGDFTAGVVESGSFSGALLSADTLLANGDAWIGGDFYVALDSFIQLDLSAILVSANAGLTIDGNLNAAGFAAVFGATSTEYLNVGEQVNIVFGDLSSAEISVAGDLGIVGSLNADDLLVKKDATLVSLEGENAVLGGSVEVHGAASFGCDTLTIPGFFSVSELVSLSGDLSVDGNGLIGRDLTVADDAFLNGGLVAQQLNLQDVDIELLNVAGDVYVNGDAAINGSLEANDAHFDTSLSVEEIHVGGPAAVGGNVDIGGTATFGGSTVSAAGSLSVISGDTSIERDLDISYSLTVAGSLSTGKGATLGNSLAVSGDQVINGVLNVDSDIVVGGNLTVNSVTIESVETLEAYATVVLVENWSETKVLSVTGTAYFGDGITVADDISVGGITGALESAFNGGDIVSGGTLSVSERTTVGGSLEADQLIAGPLQIGGDLSVDENVIQFAVRTTGATKADTVDVSGLEARGSVVTEDLFVQLDSVFYCEGGIVSEGDFNVGGDLVVNQEPLTVTDLSLGANLDVTGSALFNDVIAADVYAENVNVYGGFNTDVANLSNANVVFLLTENFSVEEFLSQNLITLTNAAIGGNVFVQSEANFEDPVTVSGEVDVAYHLAVGDSPFTVEGDLEVLGSSTLTDIVVLGDTSIAETFTIATTLQVDGTGTGPSVNVVGTVSGPILNIDDVITVNNALRVLSLLSVSGGDAIFGCDEGVTARGTLSVDGDANFGSDITTTGDVIVSNEVAVSGPAVLNGRLAIVNDVEFGSFAEVQGLFYLNGNSTFGGVTVDGAVEGFDTIATVDAIYTGGLYVTSDVSGSGITFVYAGTTTVGITYEAVNVTVQGSISVGGSVETDNFLSLGETNAQELSIDGYLNVLAGAVSVGSDLEVSGDAQIGGSFSSEGVLTEDFIAGSLRVYEDVTVQQDLTVINDAFFGCDEGVNIGASLEVGGDVAVDFSFLVDNNLVIGENLTIGGDAYLNKLLSSLISVGEDAYLSGDLDATTLSVSNYLEVKGGIYITVGELEVGELYTRDLIVTDYTNVENFFEVYCGDVSTKSNFITDTFATTEDVVVFGDATISANETSGILGDFTVDGSSYITEVFIVGEDTSITNDLTGEGAVSQFDGSLTVGGAAQFGTLTVNGSADIGGNLNVAGAADIGSLGVDGTSTFYDNVYINATFTISGDLSVKRAALVEGNAIVAGELTIEGSVSVGGSIDVAGDTVVHGDLEVVSAGVFGSDLSVFHDTTLSSGVYVNGSGIFRKDVLVNNDTNIDSTLTVGGDSWLLTDAGVDGPLRVLENLVVHLNVEFDNDLNVDQDVIFDDELSVEGFTSVGEDVEVENNAFLGENLCVLQESSIRDDVSVAGDLSITGQLVIEEDVSLAGDLAASPGTSTLGSIAVGGVFANGGDFIAAGNANVDGSVDADEFVGSHLDVEGDLDLGSGDLSVTNNAAITGSVFAQNGETNIGNDLTSGGSFATGGNLVVGAAAAFGGNLNIQGTFHVEDTTTVDQSASFGSDLVISESLFVNTLLTINGAFEVEGLTTVEDSATITGNLVADVDVAAVGNNVNADSFLLNSLVGGGDLSVSENLELLNSTLDVGGNIEVAGGVTAGGFVSDNGVALNEDLTVASAITVADDQTVKGNTILAGTLEVASTTTLEDLLKVREDAEFNSLVVVEEASLLDSLTVTTTSALSEDLSVGGNIITETATFAADLTVGTDAFIAGNIEIVEDTSIGGELNLGGALSLLSDLEIDDNLVVDNDVVVQEYLAVGGDLSSSANTNTVGGNIETSDDAWVHDIVVTKQANASEDLSVGGVATFVGGLDIVGDVDVDGNAVFSASAYLGDELTAEGDVDLLGDLNVDGFAKFEDDLEINGSVVIGGELSVQELANFRDDVHVAADSSIKGYLDIEGTFELDNANLVLNDDIFVGEELTVGGSATICGLELLGDLDLGGSVSATSFSFTQNLIVEGNLTILGDLTLNNLVIDGNVIFAGTGSITVESVDLGQGSFAFPYPGLDTTTNLPLSNSDATLAQYVVNFAPLTSIGTEYYDIALTGCSLNILEPELNAALVARMETIGFDGSGGVTYRYEVGDIILVKGPEDPTKTVNLVDFEDLIAVLGANRPGNIQNDRNLVSEALNTFIVTLHSDEIIMYIYSPRPAIGNPDGGGNNVLQDGPVDWIKLL